MEDKLNIVGIIPARMASTRFPGKPLKQILGKAMIYHVYFRSKMARILNDVYVATCDKDIEDYCLRNNMKVVMTKDTHQRASDRAAEAMLTIEAQTGKNIDIALMIQGDEPMLKPEMLEVSLRPMLKDSTIQITNLMGALDKEEDQKNPNIVKVVVDNDNFALYFSREPIPSAKKFSGNIKMQKQIAIIPFRRDFLIRFNGLEQTPLEAIESVDMLRLLEHGYKVKMVPISFDIYGVDTPEDLEKVKGLMEKEIPWTAVKS